MGKSFLSVLVINGIKSLMLDEKINQKQLAKSIGVVNTKII